MVYFSWIVCLYHWLWGFNAVCSLNCLRWTGIKLETLFRENGIRDFVFIPLCLLCFFGQVNYHLLRNWLERSPPNDYINHSFFPSPFWKHRRNTYFSCYINLLSGCNRENEASLAVLPDLLVELDSMNEVHALISHIPPIIEEFIISTSTFLELCKWIFSLKSKTLHNCYCCY